MLRKSLNINALVVYRTFLKILLFSSFNELPLTRTFFKRSLFEMVTANGTLALWSSSHKNAFAIVLITAWGAKSSAALFCSPLLGNSQPLICSGSSSIMIPLAFFTKGPITLILSGLTQFSPAISYITTVAAFSRLTILRKIGGLN